MIVFLTLKWFLLITSFLYMYFHQFDSPALLFAISWQRPKCIHSACLFGISVITNINTKRKGTGVLESMHLVRRHMPQTNCHGSWFTPADWKPWFRSKWEMLSSGSGWCKHFWFFAKFTGVNMHDFVSFDSMWPLEEMPTPLCCAGTHGSDCGSVSGTWVSPCGNTSSPDKVHVMREGAESASSWAVSLLCWSITCSKTFWEKSPTENLSEKSWHFAI